MPIQTAAAPQHFLAIDYGFRPLFASLDGVAIAGVYATDDQFGEGRPSAPLLARIDAVAARCVRGYAAAQIDKAGATR